MSNTCATCKYRQPDERPDYEGAGFCHRFPPQVTVAFQKDGWGDYQPDFDQQFPWMQASNWCGEHKPKETTNAK